MITAISEKMQVGEGAGKFIASVLEMLGRTTSKSNEYNVNRKLHCTRNHRPNKRWPLTGFLYYKLRSNFQLQGKKLPPGSFGFPLVGDSISFVSAQKGDKINEWMQKRFRKYGPVFKTSLFGSKVVVLTGQAGNRFVFNSGDNSGISYQQPKGVVQILGKYSLFELSGSMHKLIRGAIVGFIKPESIQKFVGEMDSLVHQLLLKELDGKDSVQIVKLMKKIAFYVSCSIFFGITDEKEKERLLEDFNITIKGSWAIPLNFPGTVFHAALKARARTCKRLSQLIQNKKMEMEQGIVDTHENIISTLINLRDENGEALQEEVILDISFSLIMASHDTVAILTTLFIRYLSRDNQVYNKVLQEQMEVAKNKRESCDGRLTWSEIKMMKYTWNVAQELMRFYPPILGNFRHTTRDVNFEGFEIPKGWQLFWVASGTHLDDDIFEDPAKFDPSRFENSQKNIPPYTYVPFGAGARICPGVEFARIEAMLVTHHFVTTYEWKEMVVDEPITRQPLPYPSMGLLAF